MHPRWLRQIRRMAASSLPSANVLVTGAAGRVSTMIRSELRANFQNIRLTDRIGLPANSPSTDAETFARCELSDDADVAHVVRGVERIVHLGAYATDGHIDTLAPSNINGVNNVLNAAVAHGVRRVVLMSSMHVVGLYRRDEPVSALSEPRPDSLYGLTKLHAEQLAELYHRRHGLSVVIIRPGHVTPDPTKAEPNNWTSPNDLARLVVLALNADNLGCEVWHAMTSTDPLDHTHVDLANRFGFQFTPRPESDAHEASALMRWYPSDEMARLYRGGAFASGKAG
jgi:uronate dehydrogenase